MALSKKLLSRDEVVVRHMHTHIKVLLWRFVVEILLLVVGVDGALGVVEDQVGDLHLDRLHVGDVVQ